MYVLYDRRTSMTGRVLRRALQARGGMPGHFRRNYDQGPLLRWGSSAGPDTETDVVLNKQEAVALAAHKLASLRVMQEHGVPVPPFAEEATLLEFPVFRRDRFHAGGRDIHVITEEGPDTMFRPQGTFFTQFIPSVRELRLHIAGGELIKAQVKKGEDNTEFPIRNHTHGYTFVPLVTQVPHQDRINAAVSAVEALGLDFGAVDVLVGEDNTAYVLEVNTAASCSPSTAKAYLDAFVRIADERGLALTYDEEPLQALANNVLDGASEEELGV